MVGDQVRSQKIEAMARAICLEIESKDIGDIEPLGAMMYVCAAEKALEAAESVKPR